MKVTTEQDDSELRYTPEKFDVAIVVNVEPIGLTEVPDPEDDSLGRHLFGNHDYVPLPSCSAEDVRFLIEREREYIEEIEELEDFDEGIESVEDSMYEDLDWPGIDLGLCGAVYALAWSGCFTGTSCNGGAFGGDHQEEYPLIMLIASDGMLPVLAKCASQVGAGLERTEGDLIQLYADNIQSMVDFGPALLHAIESKANNVSS